IMGCLPGNGNVSGGDIIFTGKSLLANTQEQWRQMCGTEVSMIFQDSGNMINPIRRIGEQFIAYILTRAPQTSRQDAYQLAIKMLDDVRLPNPDNVMRSYPFELSGGMRQRVGIAMAMTFSLKLLLADEPTGNLDDALSEGILRLFEEFNRVGVTVLMATHDINLISRRSYRMLTLSDGHLHGGVGHE
ncbi:MAG: ATP-binding cassette domain-containing protein, partial [Escherichia coli]|nr:ATP-binding cassette domain-containing protein [Escherichia coli]